MSEFNVIHHETVKAGGATDTSIGRIDETLKYADRNPQVVAEIMADQFPTVVCELLVGMKYAAPLLEGLSIDVNVLSEGPLFDGGPVFPIISMRGCCLISP